MHRICGKVFAGKVGNKMKIDELRKLLQEITVGNHDLIAFCGVRFGKTYSGKIILALNHIEALLDVAEAAKQASVLMNNFYLKVSQSGHVQTINEEDNEVWFARDQIDFALKLLEGLQI